MSNVNIADFSITFDPDVEDVGILNDEIWIPFVNEVSVRLRSKNQWVKCDPDTIDPEIVRDLVNDHLDKIQDNSWMDDF